MTVEVILTALAKYKAYLIAALMGFVSSTIRLIEFKRKVREGKTKAIKMLGFTDWFLFGCMATVITITIVELDKYFEINLSLGALGIVCFWLGYLTDYLFQIIPMMLKDTIKKLSEK